MSESNTVTAVIGGSGLAKFAGLEIKDRQILRTPYGEPSSPLVNGLLNGHPVCFLARHGHGHTIPPHRVNYRANIWALNEMGIKNVIAVGAVGAIDTNIQDGSIVIPDQLIDYTFGRAHTFHDGESKHVNHIDFTHPYSPGLRQTIVECGKSHNQSLVEGATYAVTQGPRLETAAEIRRYKNDGADMVGMTSMPEAALARELGLGYALIALVVNSAAGLNSTQIQQAQVYKTLDENKYKVIDLISCALPSINQLTAA